MPFDDAQVRQLKASVRRQYVRERQAEGKTLHYLEGWWVVSEANRIFGFDAWERETVSCECVWRSPVEERFAAAYLTRVRIKVRAGDRTIVREGLGAGEAIAATPGQAHERASKAAETDATKRALSTFGSRFGLSLYAERGEAVRKSDKASEAASASNHAQHSAACISSGRDAARAVKDVSERLPSDCVRAPASAELRKPIASRLGPAPVTGAETARLLTDAGLGPTRGTHPFTRGPEQPPLNQPAPPRAGGWEEMGYPVANLIPEDGARENVTQDNDVRETVAREHAAERQVKGKIVAAENVVESPPDAALPTTAHQEPASPDGGAAVALLPDHLPPASPHPLRIDKSVLTIPEPRRLRDRLHLKFVARQPCLVCARTPSQAHHLRIAQPRALGRKVSDEFTVPLCALHHHDLHMKGAEAEWWSSRNIDPMPEALRLWHGRQSAEDDAAS